MFLIFEKIKSQSFWSYLNFGANALFILVFQKMFITKNGYGAFGEFSYFYSIFSFVVLIADIILSQRSAGWLLSKTYDESEILSIRSTFTFISLIFLTLLYLKFEGLSLGYAFFVLASIMQATWLFQFHDKMHLLGFCNLFSKTLFIWVYYIYPKYSVDIFGLAYLSTFLLSAFFYPKVLIFKINFTLLKKVLKHENILLAGRILAYFYTSFLAVIWFHFYGAEKAGELSASYRLYQQFSILISPMVSIYILKHAKGDFTSVRECFKDHIFVLILIFYSLINVLSFFKKDLIAAFFLSPSLIFNEVSFVFSFLPLITIFSSLVLNVLLLGKNKNKTWFFIILYSFFISIFLQTAVRYLGGVNFFVAACVVFVEAFVLFLGWKYDSKK